MPSSESTSLDPVQQKVKGVICFSLAETMSSDWLKLYCVRFRTWAEGVWCLSDREVESARMHVIDHCLFYVMML
jgi:hypothetical protein